MSRHEKNKSLSQTVVPFWMHPCPIFFWITELGRSKISPAETHRLSFKVGPIKFHKIRKQKHVLSPVMFPPQRKKILRFPLVGRSFFRKSTLGKYGNTLLGYTSMHLLRYSCIGVLRIVFFGTVLGVFK